MKSKLIVSNGLYTKLSGLDFSKNVWTDLNITSFVKLKEKTIQLINNYNSKIKLNDIEQGNTNQSSDNYGYFVDVETNRTIAYFFSIPPNRSSRTAFLAQDIYPALTSIIESNNTSNCKEIFNLPVYILNFNEENITDSMKINIRGSLTLGLHYIDLFEREFFTKYQSISELDSDLINVSQAPKQNKYFNLNTGNKIVEFLSITLSANTNDRYFFASKAFPAVHLAIHEGYALNLINLATQNNNTINAFKNYINKLQS